MFTMKHMKGVKFFCFSFVFFIVLNICVHPC